MDSKATKTCLFGGSFDPVHSGHLMLAETALSYVDEVVFLPAACSPFKQEQRKLFNDNQRLELLQACIEHEERFKLSELDLQLPPPSWTWRLVEHWRREHPHNELFWLMGIDQWEQLEKWARFDYLCQELCFIVHHRDGKQPQVKEGVRAIFIEGNHPASASAIRKMLQSQAPMPEGWMPTKALEQARSFLS